MEKLLPNGWERAELKSVVSYRKGKKPSRLSDNDFEGSVPYLDIRALEKGDVRQYADVRSSAIVNGDCVAMVWDGARSGWVSKIKYGALGSTIAALSPKEINVDFLFHFLKSRFSHLNTNTRGTGIPHVDPAVLWSTIIPLPPLAEQKRIVGKLDEAFQYLETLKSKLDRIPQLLKKFRETVLTHAVTGKLTDHANEVWLPVTLGELGKWTGGGTPSKSNKSYWQNGNILWITPKDMKGLYLSDSIDKITDEAVTDSSANMVPVNSILIVTRSGILRRILPVSMNILPTTVNQDLKVLIPRQGLSAKFVLYTLVAFEESIRNSCMKNGTTVESIEFPALRNFTINMPEYHVQKEIVEVIEDLLSKTTIIENSRKKLMLLVDKLPQALLTKAFKGQLVPQDENDEPASELLERIKEAKALTKKVAKLQEEFAF